MKTDERHLASVIPQHSQVSRIVAAQSTDRQSEARTETRIVLGLPAVARVMMVEVDVRYQIVLAHAAYDRFLHLPSLVPYPLEDTNRDRCKQTGNQDEEGGINVCESRAVESRRRQATRHLRQHPLGYPIQNAALPYTQYAANNNIES